MISHKNGSTIEQLCTSQFEKVRMLRVISKTTQTLLNDLHSLTFMFVKNLIKIATFCSQALLTMYQVRNVKHLPNVVKLISVFAARLPS